MEMHPTNQKWIGSKWNNKQWRKGSTVDQCIDVFVYVNRHARHQSDPIVSFAHDALFGRPRRWRTDPDIAVSVLLHPHFGRHVMDQPFNHVRNSSPIRAMAGVKIRKQRRRRIRVRQDPWVTAIAFMWRIIFAHIQHFDAVSHGEEVQQDPSVTIEHSLVGWWADHILYWPAGSVGESRDDVLQVDSGIARVDDGIDIWFPGPNHWFRSDRRQHGVEPSVPATEFQFYRAQPKSGPGRRRLSIFVRPSPQKRGTVEVVEEKSGHPASHMGRFPGQIIFDPRETIFAEVNGMHAYYRWPTGTWAGNWVHQGEQQHIFGPQHICDQWAGMFFNHVRQGAEKERKHRVHRPVFTPWGFADCSTVFGPGSTICPGVGSPKIRVFV